MLTVKIIEMPSGHERLMETREVSFHPRRDETPPTVFIEKPDGQMYGWAGWSTVYVMNESGNTVARYHLGGEVPLVTVQETELGTITTVTPAAKAA